MATQKDNILFLSCPKRSIRFKDPSLIFGSWICAHVNHYFSTTSYLDLVILIFPLPTDSRMCFAAQNQKAQNISNINRISSIFFCHKVSLEQPTTTFWTITKGFTQNCKPELERLNLCPWLKYVLVRLYVLAIQCA